MLINHIIFNVNRIKQHIIKNSMLINHFPLFAHYTFCLVDVIITQSSYSYKMLFFFRPAVVLGSAGRAGAAVGSS